MEDTTICFLGCGNLGGAVLDALVKASNSNRFIACVSSPASQERLQGRYEDNPAVEVRRDLNVLSVERSQTVILAVDPSQVESVLVEQGMRGALCGKLLISFVAGWSREQLECTLYGSRTTSENAGERACVFRTLPNVGASVGQSMTAIEVSDPKPSVRDQKSTEAIMTAIGKVAYVRPEQMDLVTAVAGSTPAFWGILADAMVDASVAVGMPREMARLMIAQSMLGSATILCNGTAPAELRDQGTSPEGCTIAGVMVLEETAVRGSVGKALREAVTVARRMGKEEHLNDTRR